MQISAHPLVVAVALGLLGPSVLRDERPEAEGRCGACNCSLAGESACERDDAEGEDDAAAV